MNKVIEFKDNLDTLLYLPSLLENLQQKSNILMSLILTPR